MAPVVGINGTAFQHRTAGGETLPDGFEPELIEPAERSQVRGRKVAWDTVRSSGWAA
jgi:hypothetical protein